MTGPRAAICYETLAGATRYTSGTIIEWRADGRVLIVDDETGNHLEGLLVPDYLAGMS